MVRRACVGRVGGVLEGGLKRTFQVELIALRIGRDASREVCFEIWGIPSCIAFRPRFRWVLYFGQAPVGCAVQPEPRFAQNPVRHAVRPYPRRACPSPRILSDAPFDRSLVGRAYFLGKCTRSRLCYRKTHETYQRGGKPPLFYCEIIQIGQHNTK